MSTINPHTTRAPGTILTATIYNADHVNHVLNATNLNLDKLEGATPPVVDGHVVVFDGTGGAAIKTSGKDAADINPAASNAEALAGAATNRYITANNLAYVFDNRPATEGAQGAVEMATTSEIRSAATGAKAIMAEDIETASANVALTDAATIAVNWDSFIFGNVGLTANRQLGNPTNGQVGTWRTIYVYGNDGTSRTLTFSSQYLGDVPTLTDITSSKGYLLSIFCLSTSHFVVSAHRANG